MLPYLPKESTWDLNSGPLGPDSAFQYATLALGLVMVLQLQHDGPLGSP